MIRQPSGKLGVLVLLMGNDSGPPHLKPVAKRDRGVGVLIRLIVRSPNRDTHLHRYYRDSEIMISRGTNADGRGTSTGFSTSKESFASFKLCYLLLDRLHSTPRYASKKARRLYWFKTLVVVDDI